MSASSNIWTLGIVMWEVVEMGSLPYGNLSDEEVITKVIINQDKSLANPARPYTHQNKM